MNPDRTHKRFDPLARRWVLLSPHRTDRPWQGEKIATPPASVPAYDPACYLCPGNARANGERNPAYEGIYVFENDFPALRPPAPDGEDRRPVHDGLFVAEPEDGTCRVLCFSPRHDLHFASMPQESVARVVDAWADQYTELGSLPYVKAVTIFENHGAAMGASNPHPHGQIWANSSIPNELATETASLADYRARSGRCMLCDYAEREVRDGARIVYANELFVALVPYWAVWPFEALVLPRAHRGSLAALEPAERAALADAIRNLATRYNGLFDAPFPYSMGFHQAPNDGGEHAEWHVHAHYYPPLLRSASVRKYMVGYEMLAQPQRDLTPERAAEALRNVRV